MTGVWWDICSEDLDSPDEAEAFVYDTLMRVFPHGGHGFTMWWGAPLGDSDNRRDSLLRVDLDVESGRASLCWLPTGDLGVEPGVAAHYAPLTVMECSDYPAVSIAPERARVTPGRAIRAIREFVVTQQRPTCVDWEPPP